MTERFVIADMATVLSERLYPTITLWNRLEARPRSDDFDRALRVEVRDPLWMLSRQWQLGEFRGDDAGSPIFAKVHMKTTQLTRYQAADHPVRPFSTEEPLEAQVEQRPIPFTIAGQAVSLDLRLLMGRQWLKMLAKSVGDFAAEYRALYPIAQPDPENVDHAAVAAHLESWQQTAAVAGRLMDGYAFYQHLKAGGDASVGTSIPPAQHAAVAALGTKFVSWLERLYFQPDEPDENAWQPSRLEYRFACSAPRDEGEQVYVAEEYHHGRLDWYSVDIDPKREHLDEEPAPGAEDPRETFTQSFVPVQLAYEGMPNTRWWTFEDRKTNFGDITPDTTELGKLMFMEFGLIYANDWFLVPHALPAGSLAQVAGLAVTNVFGERTWVEPAGRGEDDAWQRWAMYVTSVQDKNREAADTRLLLLPTVPKVQEGEPIEDLLLIRDEMANMVWGVETRVPLPSGDSKAGAEAGRDTFEFHRRRVERALAGGALPPDDPEPKAPIRYRVMSSVPEHWIPFVPVHVEGDNREIQLQRASMPRIIEGDPEKPVKVEPRTVLLREGLDRSPKEPYFLHEEEVTRAGVRVYQAFQRTRWYGGRVVTWLGVRKETGRGGGASGLAFDYLQDVLEKR